MITKFTKSLLLRANSTGGSSQLVATRPLWAWLNGVWNEYDPKRVKEVGPNRACAEWLVKCGAHIKFKNWGSYTNDYNKLPPGAFEAYQIEEVKAVDACIMAPGFEYFKGCNNIKRVALVGCTLVDDQALAKMSHLRESLEDLNLVYLELVTDVGLSYLYLFKNLQRLHMNYLPNVKEPELAVKLIKEKLPKCDVVYIKEPKLDPETEEKLKESKKKKFPYF